MSTVKEIQMTTHNCLTQKILFLLLFVTIPFAILHAQQANKSGSSANEEDDLLIDKYIKSMGYSDYISFDASNIKQFWIDNSVVSKDGLINIYLAGQEKSRPNNVKLINVSPIQDCTVDIIAETKDLVFEITDNNGKMISSPLQYSDYIHYKKSSSSFHLYDTEDFSFNFVFSPSDKELIEIKKIVLSFSQNKQIQEHDNLNDRNASIAPKKSTISEDGLIQAIGGSVTITGTKEYRVPDNASLITSVTIENTGSNAIHVVMGYIPYSSDHKLLLSQNYPSNGITAAYTVLNAEEGKDSITIDHFPDAWNKNGHIALDAKPDQTDIPCFNLLEETILNVEKKSESETKITLNKPLSKTIKNGTPIRITGGGLSSGYLYPREMILQPNEKKDISVQIRKNNESMRYRGKELSKGMVYIKPVAFISSAESGVEVSAIISNYSVTITAPQ